MPKIEVPSTINVAIDEIEDVLHDIEYLVDGRLDMDNFLNDGDEYAALSPSAITDYANSRRKVQGDKFFGHIDENGKIIPQIFNPLIDLMNKNFNFRAITLRIPFFIHSNETIPNKNFNDIKTPFSNIPIIGQIADLASVGAIKIAERKEREKQRKIAKINAEETGYKGTNFDPSGIYTQTASIKIPNNIKIMTYGMFADFLENNNLLSEDEEERIIEYRELGNILVLSKENFYFETNKVGRTVNYELSEVSITNDEVFASTVVSVHGGFNLNFESFSGVFEIEGLAMVLP